MSHVMLSRLFIKMAESWPRPVVNSGLSGLKWGLGSALWEAPGDSGTNACRTACGKGQMLGEEGKRGCRVHGGCFFNMFTASTKPLVHEPPRLVFRRDQR